MKQTKKLPYGKANNRVTTRTSDCAKSKWDCKPPNASFKGGSKPAG